MQKIDKFRALKLKREVYDGYYKVIQQKINLRKKYNKFLSDKNRDAIISVFHTWFSKFSKRDQLKMKLNNFQLKQKTDACLKLII